MGKQNDLQFLDKPLVDLETGEVLDSGPEVLSDDALLMLISELKETLSTIRNELNSAEQEMVRRLNERQATIYQSSDYQVKLEPQRSYEYNLPKLLKLKDLVDQETFERAIKTEYKPSKTQLNKLVKYGGEIREIIESATREVPKPPRLAITKVS